MGKGCAAGDPDGAAGSPHGSSGTYQTLTNVGW